MLASNRTVQLTHSGIDGTVIVEFSVFENEVEFSVSDWHGNDLTDTRYYPNDEIVGMIENKLGLEYNTLKY